MGAFVVLRVAPGSQPLLVREVVIRASRPFSVVSVTMVLFSGVLLLSWQPRSQQRCGWSTGRSSSTVSVRPSVRRAVTLPGRCGRLQCSSPCGARKCSSGQQLRSGGWTCSAGIGCSGPWLVVSSTSNPASSARSIRTPLARVSHPRSTDVSTSCPKSRRRRGLGVPLSNSMRIRHPGS